MTPPKPKEERWEVVEIDKEKVVLLSPSGQRVELTERPDGRILAITKGIESSERA
jgi:hypothetical protein